MHPFTHHALAEHAVRSTMLPAALIPDAEALPALWALHPAEHAQVRIMGRMVAVPRWQQAYGQDYAFAGGVSVAGPIPAAFAPYLDWARRTIEPRLNGLLVNWYDAAAAHYIGRHRDEPRGLVPDTPIVTVSLGATRTLRMRPWKGKGFVDLPMPGGSVYVIPWATNRAWTHEVPHFARDTGRRISVTLRAFLD